MTLTSAPLHEQLWMFVENRSRRRRLGVVVDLGGGAQQPDPVRSAGVDHQVLRDELSNLGIAQALALIAQDHADGQLRSTIERLHRAGLAAVDIAQLTGSGIDDVTVLLNAVDPRRATTIPNPVGAVTSAVPVGRRRSTASFQPGDDS